MKKLSIVVAASLLVALAGSTCFAAINAGENEVNIFGAITSTKDDGASDSTKITIVRGGIGHFFTENISAGLDTTIVYTKSGGPATTVIVLDGNAKYHFATASTVVPYVGIQAGALSMDNGGSSNDSGYNYGAMGGVKFFMTENASFNAEFNYRKDVIKPSAGPDLKSSTTALLFGLSYYFGK